jgi:hypothetical protein
MNPGGIVEETSKQVGFFMSIMRQQPLSLALVVMNFALLGFIFFIAHRINETRKFEFEAIYKAQKEVQELLSRCIVPSVR